MRGERECTSASLRHAFLEFLALSAIPSTTDPYKGCGVHNNTEEGTQ